MPRENSGECSGFEEAAGAWLVSECPDALWTSGADGVRTFHNSRWADLAGVEESGPRSWAGAIHPSDAARVLAEYETALQAGVCFSSDYRVVHADGTVRWVRDRANPRRRDQEFAGFAGSMADVTAFWSLQDALSRAQSAMNRRLAELAMLYESVPVGLGLIDREGRFMRANGRMAAADGAPVEHHFGRDLDELSPELAGAFQPLISRARDTGRPAHGSRVRTPSVSGFSRCCDWELSVHPVRDVDGAIHGYGLVAVDVTDQVALEEQVARAQHLEGLGYLAQGAAHDFNNLLTIILGSCGVSSSDPQTLAAFGAIEEAARRAVQITGQLSDATRPGQGRIGQCDLRDLLLERAALLTRILKPDVRLVCESDAAPAFACLDKDGLSDLLMRLATNARERMRGGGVLKVSVARVDWESDLVNRVPEAAAGIYVRLALQELWQHADERRQSGDDYSHLYESARRVGGYARVRSRREGTTIELFFRASEAASRPAENQAALARAA